MVLEIFYGISTTQAALIVGLSVAVYVTLGGLSAVIATDTIQFLLLSSFVLVMSVLVMGNAGNVSGLSFARMVGTMDGSWWNPLSIGMPMVLIFSIAIIPGWISEQDRITSYNVCYTKLLRDHCREQTAGRAIQLGYRFWCHHWRAVIA